MKANPTRPRKRFNHNSPAQDVARSDLGYGAVVLILLVASVLMAAGDPAVFAGVVARGPAVAALANQLTPKLTEALKKRGVASAAPLALTDDGVARLTRGLTAAVTEALGRYQDGDFLHASERADDAISTFEKQLAYRVRGEVKDPSDPWALYSQALVVKALATRKLGKDERADDALRQLACTQPDRVPDPSYAPPKTVARHQELLDALRAAAATSALRVTSTTPGATVTIDGSARGVTPLTVALLPGTHFVATMQAGALQNQRIDVQAQLVSIDASGGARAAAVQALRAAIENNVGALQVIQAAKAVADDVVVAVVVGAADQPRVLVLRVLDGNLLLAGTAEEHGDGTALKPLIDAVIDAVATTDGVWLPRVAGDSPSAVLFDATVDDADAGNTPYVIAGVAVGALVVVGAGAVVLGVVLSGNSSKVEIVVDASSL